MLDLRESETYKMILEEGIEKGKQEVVEKFQAMILEFLRKRFVNLPESVAIEVREIRDLDRLDQALSNALDCESLETFLRTLK